MFVVTECGFDSRTWCFVLDKLSPYVVVWCGHSPLVFVLCFVQALMFTSCLCRIVASAAVPLVPQASIVQHSVLCLFRTIVCVHFHGNNIYFSLGIYQHMYSSKIARIVFS